MRIAPNSQVAPARVHRVAAERTTEPPTNIWSPGALLYADLGGIRYYGSVCYVDEHVDYMTVHASHFVNDMPLVVAWSGTRSEFAATWSFARYSGVG